ncbi:MAG: hypothetical protein MUE96_04480 [Bacteroidia bacterium]|jgi:hypothetical protein|nr:hypothetical protein [Bacteroidia bacterium]
MQKFFWLTVLFIYSIATCFAQDPPGDFIDSDPELPVDGGLGGLLLLGIGYALKKLYKPYSGQHQE